MSAFSEEQQAVLREVLHHVWSRMGTLHDDLNEDSLRLASAIATLGERGLLTPEEMERIAARIHVEASLRVRQSAGRALEGRSRRRFWAATSPLSVAGGPRKRTDMIAAITERST